MGNLLARFLLPLQRIIKKNIPHVNRYFIYLGYNGKNFSGWQVQPNGMTVQQCLEEALATLLRQPVPVVGAGRTDAGVHARLMVAHFDWGEPVARPAFPVGEAEPFTSERYCRLPDRTGQAGSACPF